MRHWREILPVRPAGAREACALAERGDFTGAVRTAEAALSIRSDPDLERRLIAWRHRAALEAAPPPGPETLSVGEDPFPDLKDKIPEIEAARLSGPLLGAAIAHHGSLIVRGLLDSRTVKSLVDEVDRAFKAKETGRTRGSDYVETDAIADPELAIARDWQSAGALLMVDTPRFHSRWVQVLRACGAYQAIADHLGEQPILSGKKTTLYRVPAAAGAQWHQDGAFLGKDTRTVNCWVALSDCGEHAPGLDIVPWRIDSILPTGTHGSFFVWSVGEGLVEEVAAGRPIESPVFRPGDAVLFDHMCLHRTGVRPEMTQKRYAIESWLFAPSRYPDDSPVFV